MTAQDYIFPDVSGIAISGEVLPQHDAQGAWRPERAEDWAVLAEAWGERSLIAYMDAWGGRTQQERAARVAGIKTENGMANLRVPQVTETDGLLEQIRVMLLPGYRLWCAGAPTAKTWESDGRSTEWEVLCPEIFPARELTFGTGEKRWTVARLRAAFADLAENECYLCRNWYDPNAQTHVQECSGGTQNTNSGLNAYFNWSGYDGSWEIGVPNAPTLTLPERAGTPTLVALFHSYTTTGRVNRWYLKVLQPNGITKALLRSMAETPQSDEYSYVELVRHVMVVPINLRTKLGA